MGYDLKKCLSGTLRGIFRTKCLQRKHLSPQKGPPASPEGLFVEMEGLEPSSKHRSKQLSTRLFFL